MGIMLNDDQITAVYEGERWNKSGMKQLFEISGPAGSGKTFLAKYLIDIFKLSLDEVLCIAYMGKAALQLSRSGLPAKTCHSAIYDYVKVIEKDEDGNIIYLPNGKPKTKFDFVLKKKLPKHIKMILIDEGGMIPEKMARDILSFGLPVMVLGDLNQLPPVFGKAFFLRDPDVVLTQIMRQAEGNPVIYMAHQILAGKTLQYGCYGNSNVIRKSDMNNFMLSKADVVLTGSNKLRYEINKLFREQILDGIRLDRANVGEKVICRKNNWGKCVNDMIYLMNGLSGYVDYVDFSKFNGKKFTMDFKPDFVNKTFKNLQVDYEKLMAEPKTTKDDNPFDFTLNKFEFSNAITTHLSQGSQWPNIVMLVEKMPFLTRDTYMKLLYTGITRAEHQITVVY